MSELGLIHAVKLATSGSYLALDAAISAQTLTLESVLDFNEGGGTLTLNGVGYTYDSADFDLNTIHLTTGLVGAALATDRVDVTPTVVEKSAMVLVDHTEDSLTVRVPHALMDRVPEGIRDPDQREAILFDQVEDQFVITDIIGRQPVIDGTHIDPTTLPPNPSDGNPPASSPTPTVQGGIRQLFLSWSPVSNADPVTYDVHMSTTAAFTAGPSNLIGSTEGTTFIIQVENPDYAISYYVKIIARDADGAAAAGTEVAAMLVPINSPDLAANIILANHILAGEVRGVHFASDLLESGVIQTAAAGRRVRISLDGIQLIESDDSLVVDLSTIAGAISSFYGELQTTALTSLNNFEMRGANNEQGVGSTYTLAAGVTPSATPPVATVTYPVSATTLDNVLWKTRGVDWGSTYNFYVRRFLGETQLLRQTIVGPVYSEVDLDAQDITGHGVAICFDSGATEDRAYVLAQDTVTLDWFIRKFDITSFPSVTTVTDYPWTHDTGVAFFAPNIGRDFNADNFITAEVLANQTQIRFRRYAANNGSLISTTTTSSGISTVLPSMPDKSIRGVARGDFGLGLGDLYMVAMVDRVWFFNPGDGSFVATPGIGPAFFTNSSQLAFQWNDVSNKFVGHNNDDSQITTYTDWNPTGNHTDMLWAAYTWYDSAGTTHETPMSAQKAFTMKKRAQVTISTPEIPGAGGADDPNAVRIYCGGPSATPLARTAMWDQATQPGTGVTAITYQTLRLATGGGAVNPPATNNFPAAAAAVLQSGALGADSTPAITMRGDGTGRWEGEGWTTATLATTWSNVAGTARFRKDPTAVVFIQGSVSSTNAVGNTTVLTLPVGYRPTQNLDFALKSNADGGTVSWVRVNASTGAVTLLGNVAQAGTRLELNALIFSTR